MSEKCEGQPRQTGEACASASECANAMQGKASLDRRTFVAATAGCAAMVALGCVKLFPGEALCRPPGAQSESLFMGACVRCQKCIETCPAGVLVPSGIEDGIASMRTPKMNFSRTSIQLGEKIGWCDHCTEANNGVARCVEVCPSGALDDARDGTFETMRLGRAVIDRETCLAWNLKGCTVCFNACPLGAISMDKNNRPVIDEDLCNGCGACEQVCVSLEATSVGQGETARSTEHRAVVVVSLEA